jgi:glutamate carboxypeptidase
MLEQVERWAAIGSGSRNLPGLAELAQSLTDAFSTLPGEISLEEPAQVESILPDGRTATLEYGHHLHLDVRPEAPRRILLTGHMDTVFGADDPFQHLDWLDGSRLNGPGVADMKGGLAIMLAALIARAAQGKLTALTYEPALPDGTLAGARAGSGNFSILVTGKSAHAGRNPQEGRNAIVAAADLAVRLKRGSGRGFSCNPARIDGGGPNNIVPDHAVLRVNFRPMTAPDERAARELIDETTASVAREHDVTMHIHGGFGRPPKPMDVKSESLFAFVRQCGTELNLDLNWRDTGGVCDGNNIAACGVPVVDTMGARGGAIHSADEFLIVDSLPERARLSALVLLRLAEGGRI